jgi:hypothetical protein
MSRIFDRHMWDAHQFRHFGGSGIVCKDGGSDAIRQSDEIPVET